MPVEAQRIPTKPTALNLRLVVHEQDAPLPEPDELAALGGEPRYPCRREVMERIVRAMNNKKESKLLAVEKFAALSLQVDAYHAKQILRVAQFLVRKGWKFSADYADAIEERYPPKSQLHPGR